MLSHFDECDKSSSVDPLYQVAVDFKTRPVLAQLFASIVKSQTSNEELKHKIKEEFGDLLSNLVQVQPTPLHVQPTPLHVQPTPLHVQPTPLHVQPTPLQIQPTPLQIQPTPLQIQPTPLQIQPTPLQIQPPLQTHIFEIPHFTDLT